MAGKWKNGNFLRNFDLFFQFTTAIFMPQTGIFVFFSRRKHIGDLYGELFFSLGSILYCQGPNIAKHGSLTTFKTKWCKRVKHSKNCESCPIKVGKSSFNVCFVCFIYFVCFGCFLFCLFFSVSSALSLRSVLSVHSVLFVRFLAVI